MTPTADELHQVLRNVIALRRKLNLEVPEGKISPVETSPHSRDFDFQFDGENLVVSGTGLRGIYQQRVPLPLLIQLVEAAQSLREPFTVRDVEQLLVKHHNAAPPQYTIYATLRFLEAYEFCEKVGRGRYALRKFSQGELRTRVDCACAVKNKIARPAPTGLHSHTLSVQYEFRRRCCSRGDDKHAGADRARRGIQPRRGGATPPHAIVWLSSRRVNRRRVTGKEAGVATLCGAACPTGVGHTTQREGTRNCAMCVFQHGTLAPHKRLPRPKEAVNATST